MQWRRVSFYWNRAGLPAFAGFVSGSTFTWMSIDHKYQAVVAHRMAEAQAQAPKSPPQHP